MWACPFVRHPRHRQTRRYLLQQCRPRHDQAGGGQLRHVRRVDRPDEGPAPCSKKFVAGGMMASPESVADVLGRERTGPPSLRSAQRAAGSAPKRSGGEHPRHDYVARCAAGSGVGHLPLSIRRSLPGNPEIRKYGERRPAANPGSTCGEGRHCTTETLTGRPTNDPPPSQRASRGGGGPLARQRPQRSATGSSGLASSIRPSRTSGAKGPRGART